jgi:hypothetical protein
MNELRKRMMQALSRRNFMRSAIAATGGLITSPFNRLVGNFNTASVRHAILVCYGGGVRTKDVIRNVELAPMLNDIADSGVLFTADMCDTAECHEQMFAEMLTGAVSNVGRPRVPTIFEYVRKEAKLPATHFWLIQPLDTFRGKRCDDKGYSSHPQYGGRYGAIDLCVNKWCYTGTGITLPSFLAQNVDSSVVCDSADLMSLQEFIKQAIDDDWFFSRVSSGLSSNRYLQINDCLALSITLEVLKRFTPTLIVVRLLGFDDAHGDHGYWSYKDPMEEYFEHIAATDALIGRLWQYIQNDPYFCATTSIVIRPDCGRNSEAADGGKLDHSKNDDEVSQVWSIMSWPQCPRGLVVQDPVNRLDICPTLVHSLFHRPPQYSSRKPRFAYISMA